MRPKIIRMDFRREAHARMLRTNQPLAQLYIRDGDKVFKATITVYTSSEPTRGARQFGAMVFCTNGRASSITLAAVSEPAPTPKPRKAKKA